MRPQPRDGTAAAQRTSQSLLGLLIRHQFDAPVLSATLSRVVRRYEVSLAIAVRYQLARRDSGLHQVIHYCVRSPIRRVP